MASGVFNLGKAEILKGNIDLDGGDIRILLVNTSYSFDPDSDYVSQISANEISGGGYVRKALASLAVTEDDTNNRAKFSSAATTWTALGAAAGTVGGCIIYKYNAADSSAILIYFGDFTDTPANGGDFTVTPHADGYFYF